jgi:lysyl oxidase
MRRLFPLLAAAALLAVLASPTQPAPSRAQAPEGPQRLLPDMSLELPKGVAIAKQRSSKGTRTLLTFSGASANYGDGPLKIRASRPSRSVPTMTADQLIDMSDGTVEVVPKVGTLRYVTAEDHRHWHLQGFMRYELHAADGRSLRRDRKSGYCLGDRYDTHDDTLTGKPPEPVYTSRCGLGQPTRLDVSEGISIGYGDIYAARIEGQYIDITGLAGGNYVLVQRVNPSRKLVDFDPVNDVGSLLVRVSRSGSKTTAKVLDRCRTELCPEPGR